MTIPAIDITMHAGAGGVLVHPPVVPGPLTGLADPVLVTNVGGVADWSNAFVPIDLMKQSRPFSANNGDEWNDLNSGGHLDANGWPQSYPDGATVISTVWDHEAANGDYYGGESFTVTWEGAGTVEMAGSVGNVSNGSNTITFDLNVGYTTLLLNITSLPVTNIRIIPQRFQANYDAEERINPDFKEFCSNFRLLRYMDWTQTNWSDIREWSDRTTEDAVTFSNYAENDGNHTPWEWIPELANATMTDVWICLPHLCTDDFILQCLTELRNRLNPALKIYIEFSNEVWNFVFPHQNDLRDMGRAWWPFSTADDSQIAINALAKRSVEAFAIADTVFAGQTDRLVKVLGTSNDDVTTWSQWVTSAAVWEAHGGDYVRPSSVADCLAIAPYYGTAFYGTPGVPAALDQHYQDGTHREYIYNWLTDPANDSSIPSMISNMQLQYGVAQAENLTLQQYEGARHYQQGNNPQEGTNQYNAFLDFSNSTYGADLVIQAWEAWEPIGSGPFQVYAAISSDSVWGFWGYVNAYGDTSPYAEALAGLNHHTPNWWNGTGDYRHAAIPNATDYSIDPGTSKPVSGQPFIQNLNYHVFGHSIFTYDGGGGPNTSYTRTGEWLGLLAAHAGLGSVGSFTFSNYHTANATWSDPPNVSGGYSIGNTSPVSPGDFSTYDLDVFIGMPSNYLPQDTGYPPYIGDIPGTVTEWGTLDTNVRSYFPQIENIIYAHWPEAAAAHYDAWTTDTKADFTIFNNATMDESHPNGYLGWFIEFQNQVVASGGNPRMIPVGAIIAYIFENVPELSSLTMRNMYVDADPHGSENIYFLSAMVCFRFFFGPYRSIRGFTFPGASAQMHSLIMDNVDKIDDVIIERLSYHNQNGVRVFN